jgi:SH3 domain-containing protein
MSREEHDPEDMRTTRSSRRSNQPTDRLPGRSDYGDPVNPNWRSERMTGRNRRTQTLPTSRQELMLWLQYGGWRFLAIGAAIAIIAIFGFLFFSQNRRPLVRVAPTAEPQIGQTLPELPSPTPPISATTQLTSPGISGGAQFRVFNTGSDGLFLRSDPSSANQPIKTLPEGTIVTIIGEDSFGSGHVWKHVRDPDGAEGWVAADFLQPVQ